MRDLVANLWARLQATNRQERLYVALAVVGVLVLLRFGFSWVVEYRSGVKEDIQLTADRLANAKRLVSRGPETEKQVSALRDRYQQTVAQLVPGDTPTLAAAALQEKVSSLAAEKNVSLQTTQVMKDEAVGSFRKVALRITATGELRNLADFLASLEYGSLRVSIPFIELSRRGAARRDNAARAVSATIEVAGVVQGSAARVAPASTAEPAPPGAQPPPGGGASAPVELPPPNIPSAGAEIPADPLGTSNLVGEAQP